MAAFLERLHHNDPDVLMVRSQDIQQGDEYLLGPALLDNFKVHSLSLDERFGYPQVINTNLTNFLRGSTSLREFRCQGWSQAQVVGNSLQALALNRHIELIKLSRASIPIEPFKRLLRDTTSLTELVLFGSTFESANELATCLQENHSLKMLKIAITQSTYMAPLLKSAVSLSRLKKLTVSKMFGETNVYFGRTIRLFLESTAASDLNLQIELCTWNRDLFDSVLQGFRRGRAVTKLSLRRCSFDKECTDRFSELFMGESSLHALELVTDIRTFSRPLGTVMADLVKKGNTKLRRLQFGNHLTLSPKDAVTLLEALQGGSPLESLVLGQTINVHRYQAMVDLIPRITSLKELDMRISFLGSKPAKAQSRFVRTLERNGSLQKITIRAYGGASYPDGKLQTRLGILVERNRRIDLFQKCPQAVPKDFWPSALAEAFECDTGLDIVWPILRCSPNFLLRARNKGGRKRLTEMDTSTTPKKRRTS